jgi:glycosyltransferase involved in cell wall biosynthesis
MQQINKINADISSRILTVGADYRNHRGGIGAVLEVYHNYFEVFNFIESYKVGSALLKGYVFILCLIRLVLKLLSDRKIKIVHIHGSCYSSFYRKFIIFILCKYIFRKTVIYHFHGGGFIEFYNSSNYIIKRLISFVFSNADCIICLSPTWKEYYEENFKIKKLIILPNIIDYPIQTEIQDKNQIIILLFLGFITKAKGIFDVLQVISENKDHYRNRIRLLIGGTGQVEQLKELIRINDIEDIVIYLGWVSSNEKANILSKSDIYILPSYFEGLPISILESMSYGKAIISTNVGGIPDIVKNKENGILINPGNLEQIKETIDCFLENPDLIQSYGLNSKKMVNKHLPDSVLRELENLYESLL